MFTLIIGASASGKSEYAEKWVSTQDGSRIYLATMEPYGEEAQERIKKHKAQRLNRGFETIERYTGLGQLVLPAKSNILLEDLGNLTANELFSEDGGGAEAVLDGVLFLSEHCRHLTVVTNEVFSGGMTYQGETLAYLRALAMINRILARKADRVVEVACGLPLFLK